MVVSEFKPLLAVDTCDIIRYIFLNLHGFDYYQTTDSNHATKWNKCCNIFDRELNHIQYELPDQIKMEDEYRISKVIVSELKHDGWILKFTKENNLVENYFILFTD